MIRKFLNLYATSFTLSVEHHSTLGLAATRFVNNNEELFKQLAIEERDIEIDHAKIKDGEICYNEDKKGNKKIVIDASLVRSFNTKIEAWKDKPLPKDMIIQPIKLDSKKYKALDMSPYVYKLINNYVIECSEEEYIKAQEMLDDLEELKQKEKQNNQDNKTTEQK